MTVAKIRCLQSGLIASQFKTIYKQMAIVINSLYIQLVLVFAGSENVAKLTDKLLEELNKAYIFKCTIFFS